MMLRSRALIPSPAGAGLMAACLRERGWVGAVPAAAQALTLLLAIRATLDSWSATLSWSDTLPLRAVLTPLSVMVAILVPTIALPVLVYAAAQERRPGLTRLMALLIVFTGGMELLVVADRSEEHTSELQSLMRISSAVFCLKTNTNT